MIDSKQGYFVAWTTSLLAEFNIYNILSNSKHQLGTTLDLVSFLIFASNLNKITPGLLLNCWRPVCDNGVLWEQNSKQFYLKTVVYAALVLQI